MIKRGKENFVIVLMILFSLAFVSASIEITQQPYEVYNFGDSVFVSVNVNPVEVSGNFEINLICGTGSTNFYKISPAESAFSANVLQKINHKIILTKEYIGALSGDCHIEALIGKENVSSNHFLLTDDISLIAKIDNAAYNPGETVLVSINATKANGVNLNGNYEVSSSASFNGKVERGIATNSFKIASDAPAGKYELVFFVYDSDSSGFLNQKKTSLYYEVKQIPTKLDLSLSSFEALPNQDYSFSVDVFDQSGIQIPGTVLVSYTSPKKEKNSLNVVAGMSGTIHFASDASAGNYILTATSENLTVDKQFNVKEVANISVDLLEELSMVSVTNIGNVPYEDSLNVTIGNETESIFVNLDLGEEKRYNLRAPTGVYSVIAQIGGFSTTKQLSLTGKAISVGSWTGIGLLEQYPLVWAFIAVILIITGIIIYVRSRHLKTHDYYERANERARKEMKDEDLNEVSRRAFQKKQFLNLANPIVNEALSVPTLKGNRDSCSVVALNIKNYTTLGIEARNKINEIITSAKDKYGVLEFRGQHMLIIYSPLITKTYKNEIIAAKAAWKIRNEIDSYNAKFRDKIKYNVGVNAGEMVASLSGGKLMYTNLGNGVILAKRISDLSEGKILVSASFRQKLLRELKVKSTELKVGNSEVMEVISMSDVDGNKERFNDIMRRNEFSRRG